MRPVRRPLLWVMVAMAALLLLVPAAHAADDELTPDQEATAQKLEGELIAPCCWTQPVADHQSEASDSIKSEIRMLVVQGKSESEILDVFVDKWGEEILAAPRAAGFNWLAYLFPALAVVVAGVLLTLVMLHWRRRGPAEALVPVVESTAGAGRDADLRRRVDEELDSFDV